MNAHSAAVSLTIVATLFLLPPCLGQSTQSGGGTPGKDTTAVNIFFSVGDAHGTLIPGLSKDSFQVRENGRPQTIGYFAARPEQPLNVGLLVDTSGRMQGALPAAKFAVDGFLRRVLTDQDLAFAMSFDITVDLLQDLTNDRQLLRSGLDRARVNVGISERGFKILLHDAVFLASDEILRKQFGRKALVILTNGDDRGSRMKIKEAIEAAQRADATCYVLLFGRSGFGSGVNDLAEQTGGRVITVKDAEKLTGALNEVANELREQYCLGYTPENDRHDGAFRTIEITSKEGYKVRARKGYYPPAGN